MPSSPLRALLWAALALAGPAALPAHAGLLLTIQNDSTAAPGGTGSFDVLLSNSNDGDPVDVSGFSFELQVASDSGIQFTGVTTNTTVQYLFGTLQASPLTFSPLPASRIIASDAAQTAPYFVTVGPGATFGLGRVEYSVAAGTAPGPVSVSFLGTTGGARTTDVFDVDGNPLSPAAADGSITVADSVVATPEPSGVALMASGLATAGLAAARRARRRA